MDSKESGLIRDSVVFYRSFYEAIRELPPEQFKACVTAILNYGLDGNTPTTNGIEKTVFALVKPQIDANNKRYENGAKGGRPSTLKNQSITEEKPNQNQDITKPKPSDNQTITKTKPNNNQSITKPEPNVNVNDNVNIKKKDTNVSKEKASRFCPPTTQEVSDYCQEKGYNVDCERFIDYYTSNGWMVGKNKMKDWKACVRNWSRTDSGKRLDFAAKPQRKELAAEVQKSKFRNFEERAYTSEQYNALLGLQAGT